ncbi:hypothetical protein TRFO_28157 [Tritrichomonas foetus]|uniref:FMP27 GFWDK domain-containing protein n=1 Tax=Tritrichomonas foetus TaxID=1144522 RepID=A0A1J4K4A8_9EUKA|nr:hypothetical protein TRFO_28157 [Tritrichomonas foetus]|eukprot:OHT04333.1 hypothetical protein TRFO_28157 [Tritrichomonas foetus]
MIFFLLILSLLGVLLFFVLKFILNYILYIVIKNGFKIEKGNKIFSFSSVSNQTNLVSMSAQNLSYSMDILGLFSTNFIFLDVTIDSVYFENYDTTNKLFFLPSHTVSENIYMQVCIHILTLLIKRIHFNINKIVLKHQDYSIECHNVIFKYSKVYSFAFQLDISRTILEIFNYFKIELNPITFSPKFGVDPILSLINLEAILIPFEFKLSRYQCNINKSELVLNPIEISISLPRGIISLTTPKISGKISPEFPEGKITVNEISGFLSRQLIVIPHLVLNVTKISVSELEIINGNRKLIKINDFHGSRNENDPWNIQCQNFKVYYHTKTIIKLLPFLSDNIFPLFMNQTSNNSQKENNQQNTKNLNKNNINQTNSQNNMPINIENNNEIKSENDTENNNKKKIDNEKYHPSIPDCLVFLNNFTIKLKITDSISLLVNGRCLKIKNKKIKIPVLVQYANDYKIVSIKLLKLFVDQNNFLNYNCSSFHIHDRSEISFQDVLTEIKLGLHTISPYLYSSRLEEETFKFPFIISCDVLLLKLHDTDLNKSIIRSSQIIPKIKRESFIRSFLLNKKKSELKLADEAVNRAEFKLSELAFKDFKDRISQSKKHHYSFHFILEKCSFAFNSQNFTDKLKMIHQIDPITKKMYPNIDWDIMMGFNFELKSSNFQAFAFDIETPLIEATSINFVGPMIIARPISEKMVKSHFTIDGDTIPLYLNPANLIIYADMFVFADRFYCYYGDCFQSIYQEMTIRLYSMLPSCVDPSPRFAWFDLLRAFYRGQYLFKVDNFELRFPAKTNFRETDNYLPLRFNKFRLLCRENEITLNSERLTSPRIYNGREGPVIIDIPHIALTLRYHWISNGDPRLFIAFPDPNKFHKNYDAYRDFRAKEFVLNDSTLFMAKSDEIIPIVTFDVAHIDWLFEPFEYILDTREVKSQIPKKLGFKNLQRPRVKYFVELKRAGNIKIIGDSFIIRVFDHFPVNGSVQGSSIDFRFDDITSFSSFDFLNDNSVLTSKFRCESLTVNATDLSYYASGIQMRSPTILVMKPFNFDYGEQTIIEVNDMLIHFNQLLLKYLTDFISTIDFKFTLPNKQFKDAKITDYPICKISFAVDQARMFFTSLEYDLRIAVVLENAEYVVMANEDDETAIGFTAEHLSTFTNDKNKENPLLTAQNVEIFYGNSNMNNTFGALTIFATPFDVSVLKYLRAEYSFEDQPNSPIQNSITEFKVTTNFPSIKMSATSVDDSIAGIDFENVQMVFKQSKDKTREMMVMVMNATVRNASKDAPMQEVLLKWVEQSVVSANRPHIQLLLKMPPKMKGAYIFSQAEFNMEPSIVHYDSRFWESFVSFLNSRFIQKPPRIKRQFTIRGANDKPMPFVVYDKTLFPESNVQKDFTTNKTIRVKKMRHDEQIVMMIRYLRINPISMDVTYKNPDNKILSEINNFQGQMHELIYHDLTTTTADLISKITFDVARDILPQFLKHVVGFRKPDITPEQEIEEWLKADDKRMSKEDKQKMLLFGAKNVKKK